MLKGQAGLVFGSGDGGVYAFQPRTGKPIWGFQLSRRGINVSPVVSDYNVFIAHAEENNDNSTMGAIVRIDGSESGDVTKIGRDVARRRNGRQELAAVGRRSLVLRLTTAPRSMCSTPPPAKKSASP